MTIDRQIQDIIAQAESFKRGRSFDNDIENFSKYSEDTKNHILKNTSNEMVIERLKSLPKINYKKIDIKIWHLLLLPNYLYIIYRNHYIKRKCLKDIETIRNTYSSVHFLLKADQSF